MRISTREGDPGFNMVFANRCKVFVDGVNVSSKCHTADEAIGIAWCNNGETLYGKVELVIEFNGGIS